MPRHFITTTISALAALTVAGCGGDSKDTPRPSTQALQPSPAVQRNEIAASWNAATATTPPSSDTRAPTPREHIANRLIGDTHLLPLGTGAEAVRHLLGSPSKRATSSWSYLAARWKPEQGFGAVCERYFTIRFRGGKVSSLVLGPPHCPPGVNP
jgi:hypothetical protein